MSYNAINVSKCHYLTPPNIVSCAREHFMICCSPSTVASQFNSNMPRFKINQTGQKVVMQNISVARYGSLPM